ncbi:MAG: GbsR/MarR family transcriptional regulator [Nocardioides sp.]|jgi:DNA-binding transcriptional regulator GbsR (MarR family)
MTDVPLFQAVERFGQALEGSGMARMPARVFAYVLADDADRYTAAQLAEGLQVSPAAISGAVRYLVDTGLLIKERAPGRRGDIFRVVDGDIWSTITTARKPMIDNFIAAVDDAIALVGEDTPGGRRLVETADFLRFTRADLEDLPRRWASYRDGVNAEQLRPRGAEAPG